MDERIMEMSKIILMGSGMNVPRLGEAYTLTVNSLLLKEDNGNIDYQYCLGLKAQAKIFGRKEPRSDELFTHTFSKVTSIRDTGTRKKSGFIEIRGISPKIDGKYVEAKLYYPESYNPPTII